MSGLRWFQVGALSVIFAAASCTSDSNGGSADGGSTGAESGASGGSGGSMASGGSGQSTSGNGGGGVSSTGGRGGASATGGTTSGTGGRTGSGGSGGQSQVDDGITALGVRWVGRVDAGNESRPRFSWSGTGFIAAFTGTGIRVEFENGDGYVFKAVIDGEARPAFATTPGTGTYTVADGLPAGDHTVALYRQTEGQQGNSTLTGVSVIEGELREPPAPSSRLIEIIGDSISCGYGNLGPDPSCGFSYDTESHYDTYGAVAARALDAEVSTIAISGRGMYRNNNGATDGTLPTVYDRVLTNDPTPAWRGRSPDAIVINLGTNDFAQGVPGPEFENAYAEFVETLRNEHPNAYIVCAIGPMLSDGFPPGQMQLTRIREYVTSVVDDRKNGGDDRIELLEFPTQTEADFGCDFHPKVGKHQDMGEALAARLRGALNW